MKPDPEIVAAFSMEGRVAVVTGAGSGLGREAARLFAQAGAHVILADIDLAGLEESLALVRSAGGAASVRPTDVAVRDQVEDLAGHAVGAFGRLDSWINSAGIPLWAAVEDASPDAIQKVLAVNLMGTYWACAAAGRLMKKAGKGTIVNVSSTAGDSPVTALSVYGMTKAAVNQLTRVCAKEFGPFGVRVNAVVPGWIDTPINAGMYRNAAGEPDPDLRGKVLDRMAAISPLGITGEPSDIGFALLYLASDASRFVTGHLLRVSGGA